MQTHVLCMCMLTHRRRMIAHACVSVIGEVMNRTATVKLPIVRQRTETESIQEYSNRSCLHLHKAAHPPRTSSLPIGQEPCASVPVRPAGLPTVPTDSCLLQAPTGLEVKACQLT